MSFFTIALVGDRIVGQSGLTINTHFTTWAKPIYTLILIFNPFFVTTDSILMAHINSKHYPS